MRREIKERYSCKRKRDYVTALAIFLFVMMIAFQIYLIVLLPVQIKNAETLEINVARETFLTQMDVSRGYFRYLKADTPLAKGEMDLVRGALDRMAQFAREHRDDLDLNQLNEMEKMRRMLHSVISRWCKRDPETGAMLPPQYYIRSETIEPQKYVRMLEQRIRSQEEIR